MGGTHKKKSPRGTFRGWRPWPSAAPHGSGGYGRH